MKTIDYSYFIERYNAGEMDKTEIRWFEKELNGNNSLSQEVMMRKKVDQMLLNHDLISLRNKLAGLEKTRKEKLVEAAGKKALAIRYAAVFAGLVLIGSLILLTLKNHSTASIYSNNYSAYEYPGPSRALESSVDIEFIKALQYYSKNDFVNARVYFSEYLKKNPENIQATLLYGISEMENKNFRDAKSSFEIILRNKNNLYTDHAQWYLAMCYVATGEVEKAKNELLAIRNSDSIYRNRARKIIRNI